MKHRFAADIVNAKQPDGNTLYVSGEVGPQYSVTKCPIGVHYTYSNEHLHAGQIIGDIFGRLSIPDVLTRIRVRRELILMLGVGD